jgi:hypothetical protein
LEIEVLGTFILVVCLLCAGLLWVFFRPQHKPRKDPPSRTVYAAHTQRRVLTPTTHMTGEAYGKLLRAAQGDRQQVELWIVEAQCNMPGYTRTEIIELLAKER